MLSRIAARRRHFTSNEGRDEPGKWENKEAPRAKHRNHWREREMIDRTAKGDEDKSCLDSIRVPKLAENAYNRIANVPNTVRYGCDQLK